MPEPGLTEIVALSAVALVAGTVDAIAGGGGLLTVPALLWAGLPPHVAIATNKGQSVFGSFAALVRSRTAGSSIRGGPGSPSPSRSWGPSPAPRSSCRSPPRPSGR